MSAEEEQSQSGHDDGGVGGPGAPTPLSALEVEFMASFMAIETPKNELGSRRPHCARHKTYH